MRYFAARVALWTILCASLLYSGAALAQAPAGAVPQTQKLPALYSASETLRLKILWPSGASMGEATLTATPGQGELRMEVAMQAVLPFQKISGTFTSVATGEGLCSRQYHRKVMEGPKSSEETIEFDQTAHTARRTLGGQTATSPIVPCAHDPLAFIYFVRAQMAAGRTVDASSFFLGPERSLLLARNGPESVTVAGSPRSADKFALTLGAPNRTRSFDVWISSTARREPLLVRLPLPLAVFSAELE